MAKEYIINGCLTVGKGDDAHNIGAGTKVTTITEEGAKKVGIKTTEFEKLVERGVLTLGDENARAASKGAEAQPLSAATYKAFQNVVIELEEGNPDHWTGDGKPDIGALKEKGVTMTAAERDEAWALYNAE